MNARKGLGLGLLSIAASNDPEFKKLQLEMMARYPHYDVDGEPTRSQSSEMVFDVEHSTEVEQSFEGMLPTEARPAAAVSSSQLVTRSQSHHYQVPPEPRSSHSSYAEMSGDTARVRRYEKRRTLLKRAARKLDKEGHRTMELKRDCLLIVLVILVFLLLTLWLASRGVFGATPKKRTPAVYPKGGPLKLIMDVDTGVDDAMALVFALTSERATVEAITVVAGNAYRDEAYNNTLRVLKLLDRAEVPVYKGADKPISGLWKTEEEYFGPDNFGGVSGRYPMAVLKSESKKLAHIAMRDMIKQRPKELTLIMLGPLTNLAIAMLMDPSLTDDIAQIFILGGNIYGKGNVKAAAEFNFITDPEAVRVVLQRATCPVTVVVWEAVLQATVPWPIYNEVIGEDTKLARFLRDVNNHTVECCMKHGEQSAFHLGDFLAVMAALVPDSVSGSMEMRSDVELHGDYTRGQMVHAWLGQHLPHITHNVTLVYSFDTEATANQFRKVFLAEDSDDE
ncbi:hypothetical protein HPB50_010480 [Hyalomma asiaticum]|uniref:Uncharacterized protein n=1 Tax=Hyalomma asiaticum TaxID=266040 RepID=A0ACB7SIA1_HYAAI|nr:hypothetical protein HPB50_010480 [Hyalomma asiaticum]